MNASHQIRISTRCACVFGVVVKSYAFFFSTSKRAIDGEIAHRTLIFLYVFQHIIHINDSSSAYVSVFERSRSKKKKKT